MAMTYNSLVLQIQAELDRTDADFVAQIPNFILNAHQRICRDSKNIGFEQYVTGSFIVGVPVIAKPGRWRRNITFNYGTGDPVAPTVNPIVLRSYEYLRSYWPQPTQTAAPLYYADYGYFNFLVAPTPNDTYPFELAYLELPEPLSILTQTNWLTNYAPDILLYACLLEGVIYLKVDERIQVFTTEYQSRITALNSQDDVRVVDRSSVRESD
jgi:hypothetical protein